VIPQPCHCLVVFLDVNCTHFYVLPTLCFFKHSNFLAFCTFSRHALSSQFPCPMFYQAESYHLILAFSPPNIINSISNYFPAPFIILAQNWALDIHQWKLKCEHTIISLHYFVAKHSSLYSLFCNIVFVIYHIFITSSEQPWQIVVCWMVIFMG
jgi:hypothetical protein